MNRAVLVIISVILVVGCGKHKIEYPSAKKVDTVDNYFGNEIADPYRWLENLDSDDTKKWVDEQVKVTEGYLSSIPYREKIKNRLTELWDYAKYSSPKKAGDYYIFQKNDGLQEQSIVYIQKGEDGTPEVFLDPNKLSDDGSVSLSGLYISNDAKYCGYSISRGGSDWNEFYVLSIPEGKLLEDHIEWVKFSGMSWYKDGFYYSRYDEPQGENKLKAKNEFHKLYYHKLGTPQSDDELIYSDNENPNRGVWASVSDDESYLVLNIWDGSSDDNLVYYKELETNGAIIKMIDQLEAEYNFIGNDGATWYVLTNKNAPNKKVISFNPKTYSKSQPVDVIPESNNVIESISYVGGKLIVTYLKDANSVVSAFDNSGNKLHDIDLPGIGSVGGFGGKQESEEVFYNFTSFTNPSTIYKYNIANNKSEVFRKPEIDFDVENYTTKQVFYKSKDGTEVPLFIVHKKGLEMNGNNPTLLYAYGGFNIAMQPSFRTTILPLLESDGIYAMACLRGGSEYGEAWHEAGMLEKKQNVFDDFIAAAEYLIDNKYTSNRRLAIFGGSNGGLLVGAVMLQRPDLFEVAIPAVGVLDMLRFQKFTIGWAWVPEYGSSDDSTQFDYLIKYSPLHNVKSGVTYPATLITTADHDDRVFPAHSFKFAAELQAKHTGDNPTLIRIETKVGHGAGTATSKTIEYYSDLISFMFYNMNYSPKY